MLPFTTVFLASAAALLAIAAAILGIDTVRAVRTAQPIAFRWRTAARFASSAALCLIPALAIVIVPTGAAAVRVNQLSGAVNGPLYPGTHLIIPIVQDVEVYNIRDQVYTTNPIEAAKERTPVLRVYSREGLAIGL